MTASALLTASSTARPRAAVGHELPGTLPELKLSEVCLHQSASQYLVVPLAVLYRTLLYLVVPLAVLPLAGLGVLLLHGAALGAEPVLVRAAVLYEPLIKLLQQQAGHGETAHCSPLSLPPPSR